jgi:dephospho-CoA kinase
MWNTSSKRNEIPLVIGITGGIGSGKSLVCSIFRILGVPVFEADSTAKNLYRTNAEVKEKLKSMFGDEIYSNEGELNRKLLSSIVFNDPESLRKINGLIHPMVREAFRNWITQQSGCYVLHEAAILFESGFYKMMDASILVTAPEEIRILRVMERDKLTREEVISRMSNQWKEENTVKLADFIIRNDESEFLVKQILEIDRKIREYGNVR